MKKRSLLASFRNAFTGFQHCFSTQRNFRIHLFCAGLVLLLGFFFKIDQIKTLLLFFTITLVLVLEMINTSLENLVDLLSPQLRKKAQIVKDVAAGAVLLVAILAVLMGFVIFSPYLWLFF